MISRRIAVFAYAALLCGAGRAHAQEHPITLTLGLKSGISVARPGATVLAVVSANIPAGWHLYSTTQPQGGPVRTAFTVGPAPVFSRNGPIRAAAPTLTPDANFGIVTEWYGDSATFGIPLAIAPAASRGAHVLRVLASYQTCNARYCLPPVEDTLQAAIAIAGEPVAAAIAEEKPAAPIRPAAAAPAAPVKGSDSFVLFLWLAATMGLLSLLTPCVFPMVPITVSYFSQRTGGSRANAVGHALLYAGGIVAAFSGLGLGAALLVGVAGLNRFAANPWLNIGIALLFIVFSMSLFDAVQIALPHRVVNWLDGRARSSGLGRIGTTLAMGATFAVTTLTCTAPFVGTLLVSASQGDWRWPAAGLITFSSMVALPFFVLALVPRALARLPRSGEWMRTLKGTLGFIELAAALKFLSNADLVQGWGVFTRTVVISCWVAIALSMSLYLFGVRLRSTSGKRHTLPALAALGAAIWLGMGIRGARLGEIESFLPPAGARGDGVAGAREPGWILNDLPGALAAADRQRKLVLIDFTGYTCTNCRWMEANMFPQPAIRAELDRFVRVRLFTDGRGSVYVDQQKLELRQFKTVALPLYAIVDASGMTRLTFLGMTRDVHEFAAFLSSDSALSEKLQHLPR